MRDPDENDPAGSFRSIRARPSARRATARDRTHPGGRGQSRRHARRPRGGPLAGVAVVGILGALGAVRASAVASAQSLGYFYTGMTGANIHVSASTIPNWSITPAGEVGEFIGGRFWMAAGPQTTLPITFLFFAGTYQDYLGNNFTALLSVTRTAAEVGSGGHSQVDFLAN